MKSRFRGILFWKILLGFWLTFIGISQIMWLSFNFYGNKHHEPPEMQAARRIAELQMTSAASVLQYGGLNALQATIADWTQDERRFFSVRPLGSASPDPSTSAGASASAIHRSPAAGAASPPPLTTGEGSPRRDPQSTAAEDAAEPSGPPAGEFPARLTERVTDAQGQQWQLSYDVASLREDERQERRHGDILNMPLPLFIAGGGCGLLFSLLLAWNLTRPMRQLSEGFARISKGDLSVRLFPAMRRRHDELSVVAADFDAMVERLSVLVSAREELLHDVSHELRSPLARLQLATGLARQTPASVEASLDRIDEEARRLDKMIGELLSLSRAEHQKLPDEQYFDLLGLLEAVANDARYEAQIPGVEVLLHADQQQDYTVKGDANLIRSAVENVVRNALRFSLQGQQVTIDLRRDHHWLSITVRDRGPGVDAEKLSSIFDPFVRVNSPLSGKGYGLGLSIVRKVVLAHQGEVKAVNARDGGLELTIRLPHWVI
ncbi:ATP-binding protein [Erwinia sp. B116]|uniref:ATP-binding protein n=1 Tax=Erwinia sp. B116 TaxID=1561024 RepID=UPI000C7779C3|nr:ATP-binding protein [Erwinia sp. B116]PLV63293.1 histidine kinase [Erwinia sp. B116]